MSLIRRLGDKARQAKEAQEAEDLAKQRLNERFTNVIAPSMEGLYRYLSELIEQIKLVREAFPIRYELTGYGPFEALSTFDYKLEREQRYRGVTLDLTWKVRVNPERSPVITLNGYDRIKALDEIFKRWGLGGAQGDKRAPSGLLIQANFQPRGFICCRLNVVANAEDEFVRFTFENVDRLGTTRKLLPPEQLDEAACDRLARFLVREDDDFIREDLPEHLRQRLRPSTPDPAAVSPPPSAPASAAGAPSTTAPGGSEAAASGAPAPAAPREPTPNAVSATDRISKPAPESEFELPESRLDPRLRAGFLRAIAPAETRDQIDADLQASLAEAARKAEEALRQAMREHGFEPEPIATDSAPGEEPVAASPVIPVALPEPESARDAVPAASIPAATAPTPSSTAPERPRAASASTTAADPASTASPLSRAAAAAPRGHAVAAPGAPATPASAESAAAMTSAPPTEPTSALTKVPPAPPAPAAATPPAPQRDKASAFLSRFKKTLDQLDGS